MSVKHFTSDTFVLKKGINNFLKKVDNFECILDEILKIFMILLEDPVFGTQDKSQKQIFFQFFILFKLFYFLVDLSGY
jgi:hypothetical protein